MVAHQPKKLCGITNWTRLAIVSIGAFLCLLLLYHHVVVSSGDISSFYLVDYQLPDIDGSNTSCRCNRGGGVLGWPPRGGIEELRCDNSSYDLTICVEVQKPTTPETTKLQERLRILGEASNGPAESVKEEEALLSWYRLEGNKRNEGDEGYDMYPLSIDIGPYISSISSGLPVPRAPITNPNIRLLRTSHKFCSPTDKGGPQGQQYDLVIVYKSAILDFDDRKRIREANRDLPANVGLVFVTGLPRTDGGGNFFHMNGGFDLRLPERSGKLAAHWKHRAAEARSRLFQEADLYDDLVIGDFVDTYVNLTYKLITTHRWASTFCKGKTDVFLFIDDDYVFNMKSGLQYLSRMKRAERRQLLSGPLTTWRYVHRPFREAERNKWALLPQEVPWPLLPVYSCGSAMFMGADVLHEVTIAEAYTRFLWVDDAFLGFAVIKLPGRTWKPMRGYYHESSNNGKAIITHAPFQYSLQWLIDTLHQLRNDINL